MGMLYGRVLDNKAVRQLASSTIPIVINGDAAYSGAPAKDEDPQYPMTNLYSFDRYRVWSTKVGTADTAIKLQLDLSGGANGPGAGGADKSISSAGFFGLRGHAGSVPPTTVNLGYRTRAQGYSSTAYTSIGTLSTLQARDSILQFAQVSGRYFDFDIIAYNVQGFALGSIWLGLLQDVGLFWSSDGGATWAEDHNVLLSRTAGGHMDGVARGDAWAPYTLVFRSIDNAKRSLLGSSFGSARRTEPIIILDENAVPRQFFVMSGPVFSQRFDGLYDAVLNLEQLG